MSNGQVVNVAIFGLSLGLVHQIKAILEAVIPEDICLHWTNIADPKLQWLLIGEAFMSSANIQRLLQSKKIQVLQLTKGEVSAEEELYRFNMETMSKQRMRHWVIKNTYEMKVVDGVSDHTDFGANTPPLVPVETIDTVKLLKQILNPINERKKIFDRHGKLALCDVNKQWAWADHTIRSTDYSLNFTHATVVEILDQQEKQQSLKFWLWNLLWNSPELLIEAPQNGYFKLNIWPQPKLGQQHREILRMSVLFAKGDDANSVAQRLNLPLDVVYRFIAISMTMEFMIQDADNIEKITVEKPKNTEEASSLKRFFNGLRRRLGL